MTASIPTAFELYFDRKTGHDERESEEREDLFFHSIELRNGTRKTTRHRRLDDLNAQVLLLLPEARPLEIMDVAVSSGISSAEWFEALGRTGIRCNMIAGDAVVDASIISIGRRLRALCDKTGHLMQLDIGGRAIRLPPPRRRDQLRYLPVIQLMRAAARLCDLGRRSGAGVEYHWGVACRSVKLMSPSLSRFPQLQAVEDDILLNTSYSSRFHVLRAANILNLAYFDTATLERMVRNLRNRLLPGGLLIVCRTNEQGVNNATTFKLAPDGRLHAAARLNAGSEIESLVLGLAPGC